jgi:hypothetical protein
MACTLVLDLSLTSSVIFQITVIREISLYFIIFLPLAKKYPPFGGTLQTTLKKGYLYRFEISEIYNISVMSSSIYEPDSLSNEDFM